MRFLSYHLTETAIFLFNELSISFSNKLCYGQKKRNESRMEMSMEGKKAYNGIVLLTGYLQRLYVFENIQQQLDIPHNPERINQIKELFDDTLAMIPIFEQTKELAPTQVNKLKSISSQVEELMSSYFKEEPYTFNDKVAYVASSLYAEQHVNAGIIRLGNVFNVEVNKDFIKRTKFYEERTKFMNIVTSKIKNKEQLEEQAVKIVEDWFLNVIKNKEAILNDIKAIGNLIGF